MARFNFPQKKKRLNGTIIEKTKIPKKLKTNTFYGKELEPICEDQFIYASLVIMEKMRECFGKQKWNNAPSAPGSYEDFLKMKDKYIKYYEVYREHKLKD